MTDIEVGDKVIYTSPSGHKREKGIVKGFAADPVVAYVVFSCNEDWDNYEKYTGASTHIDNLKKGWYD